MTGRTSSPHRPIWPYVAVALVIGLAVVGFILVRDLIAYSRPLPEFPSLAASPDASLHGTVAYFAMVGDPKTQLESGCVRVVAAAGAPVREVLCPPSADYDTGPQLAFRPDGRLEVTMFSWPTDGPLVVAWQKIVDVRTGEIEEVPTEELPSAPSPQGDAVNVSGEQITARSRNNTAELVLTDAAGEARLLWSAEVTPEYGMRAIWAPHGEWVLAYDGRLLVVTVGEPSQIRVLVDEPAGLGGWGSTNPPLATYAVTDLDLLDQEG